MPDTDTQRVPAMPNTDKELTVEECPECASVTGHKVSCKHGNLLAMRRQQPNEVVDLEKIRPVALAEIAKGSDQKWNEKARPPELFEQWWIKYGDDNWSVKHAAREGWYACADSLGVYSDQMKESQP